ncbi:hypothetical protein N9C70_05895, partial [Flavobacteriales bacterium]|nr:hypothetical protein [Flavobacteriales bacterium]
MPTLNLSVYRVLISAVLLFASSTASLAQLSSNCEGSNDNGNFSILIDTIATNIGVISDLGGGTTDLTGFNTYQLYLQCESPSDLLQAVGGDITKPVTILTTTSFYQADLGTALEPNAGLFSPFPQVQYDSFVTIGLESTAVTDDGEASTQLIEDSSSPVSGAFENEQDLVINSVAGSSWYIADAELASNCAAGSDLKILFAQVTTDGDIDGDIQFQVYRNGTQNGANCLRPYLQVNPLNQAGCTEISACNYDPAAFLDDGSCDFCSCADTTSFNQVSFPSDSVPGYHLDIELIANHDTTGIPELEGMKTYRFYVATAEPNDTLTAVYGNDETPLDIQSTSAFFQNSLGAATPNNIQTFYSSLDPSVAYDSWVTIGIDKKPSESGPGYSSIFTASDPNLSSSWMADFDPGSGNPGGNILANTNVGGIWSITNPTVLNGIPDEDQRVLIGQFTTSGVISGSIATQILPQTLPEGDDEYRLTFSFTTENLGTDVILVNGQPINQNECGCISDADSDGICDPSDNCSDTNACNYNSAENGECQTLDAVDVCGGSCSADEDTDGICDDVDNCIGEIDACGVCNGPGETFNCGCYEQHPSWCDCFGNTSDALGVCGGDCEADNNDNGICDADEVAGCQDNTACNYNEFANVGGVDCEFATGCDACSGATDGSGTVLDNDADNDGVCDVNEVTGCTDPTACNYDDDPTTDNDQDLCTFVDGICE